MTVWHDEGKQILDILVAQGLEGEVFCSGFEREPIRFEDNELKMMESSTRTGFGVRVVEDGRVGFAAATGPGNGRALVEKARNVARFGSEVEYEFPEPRDYPEVDTFDPAIEDLSADEMLNCGSRMVESVRAYEPAAQVKASVSRSVGTARLLNTRGLDLVQSATGHGVGLQATLVGDDGLLHTGDHAGGHHLVTDVDPVVDSVLWQMEAASRVARIEDGVYPVVFAPTGLGDILRPLLACADGDSVHRGISPWRDRIGERLLDPRFTLVDDGLLPEGSGATPWDDEGIPSQTTPIIREGILENYLLDLKSSARLGMKPTGNGFRGGSGSLPGIAASNLVVAAGDTPVEEIIGSMEDGLLVLSLMGAWGANPFAGRVSGNVNLGFRIVDGEIVGRVKDCMIYLSVFEALEDGLLSISSERELRHSTLFPHVLLDGVSVSTGG